MLIPTVSLQPGTARYDAPGVVPGSNDAPQQAARAGAALGAAGGALGQLADQRQDEIVRTEVAQADNRHADTLRGLMFGPSGYLDASIGADAEKAYPTVLEQAEQETRRIAESLQSPQARQMFERVSQARLSDYKARAGRHLVEQQRVHAIGESTARVESLARDYALWSDVGEQEPTDTTYGPNLPRGRDLLRATQNEARELARLKGFGPEQTEAFVAEVTSKAHVGAVAELLKRRGGRTALEYARANNVFASGAAMRGLEAAASAERVYDVFRDIAQRPGNLIGRLNAVEDAVSAGTVSVEERDQLRRMVTEDYADRQRAVDKAGADLLDTVIAKARTVPGYRPSAEDTAAMTALGVFDDYARAYADGKLAPVTQPDGAPFLLQTAQELHAEFGTVDAMRKRLALKVGPKDMAELVRRFGEGDSGLDIAQAVAAEMVRRRQVQPGSGRGEGYSAEDTARLNLAIDAVRATLAADKSGQGLTIERLRKAIDFTLAENTLVDSDGNAKPVAFLTTDEMGNYGVMSTVLSGDPSRQALLPVGALANDQDYVVAVRGTTTTLRAFNAEVRASMQAEAAQNGGQVLVPRDGRMTLVPLHLVTEADYMRVLSAELLQTQAVVGTPEAVQAEQQARTAAQMQRESQQRRADLPYLLRSVEEFASRYGLRGDQLRVAVVKDLVSRGYPMDLSQDLADALVAGVPLPTIQARAADYYRKIDAALNPQTAPLPKGLGADLPRGALAAHRRVR